MPGVVTRNPSTNALVFNSEDVPYGMCLGMYTIPAGQSWSVSWPQLAGTAIRVTAIYSSFLDLGVSVSYPGSVPTASTSPRNYARSLLVFCSGQPTSVSGPALRFRSSAGGNIALSPKGRGLNFIGKASLVDMTPGGGGPSLVIPDTQGSAPPYYVFRISWPTKPVPVFRIQAGQYISPNSEFYSVGAGLWEMQVCSLVSLPGNSGSSWPAITQPEIYCFGLPTSAGAVTVRDHDTGEIAFNLTAAPLLVIDGHHDWGAGDAGASRAIPGGIPGGYCGVIGSTGMSGTDVFSAGANRWRVLGKQGAFSLSGGSIVLNQMYVQMYIVNGAESPVDQRVAASNELVNLARYRMPLLKSVKTPTGAQLGYHVVTNISIDTRSAQAVAILAVHSWPDEAHYQLAAGGMAAWHWTVPVPVEPLQVGGPMMEACEDALRALPDDLSPFAGASVAPLAGDLEGARARQWALVKQTRDSLDAQPVAVDSIQLDADPSSRVDILGAIMAMQLGNETERVWRCTDNVMRTLTLDQLVRAGRAVAARRQALIEQSDALAQQIQSAQTVEAVTAVVWPT